MNTKMQEAVTHLFDERVRLTGVMEYGVSWSDLMAGNVKLPSAGARFDVSFEGSLSGEAINGRIKGVDYLHVRADGRFMLNIQATIITDDGETIALHEDGVLTPSADKTPADLHLNMTFATHSKKYGWLNKIPVWAVGKVDMAAGEVVVSAYAGIRSRVPAFV